MSRNRGRTWSDEAVKAAVEAAYQAGTAHDHRWTKEYAPGYRHESEADDFRWVCDGCTETHGMSWIPPTEPRYPRGSAGPERIEREREVWKAGFDSGREYERKQSRVELLARKALTDQDEIAHAEAWDDTRKRGLGTCAYCDDEWPCRTQRGIDRLLAFFDEKVA